MLNGFEAIRPFRRSQVLALGFTPVRLFKNTNHKMTFSFRKQTVHSKTSLSYLKVNTAICPAHNFCERMMDTVQ